MCVAFFHRQLFLLLLFALLIISPLCDFTVLLGRLVDEGARRAREENTRASNMGDQKNPEVWKAVPMLDHFDKIQRLPDKLDGAPNFRRVPGYKVYCVGQPTQAGFEKVIEKVCEKYPKDKPIVWINMRQEPVVYVNGVPVCARPPHKIGEYAELGNVTRKSGEKSHST